jgi:SCY1-like protein 1
MKLKPTKAAPAPVESFVDEWDDGGAANAWGSDDLIDVNADTDDWAAFESAPVPEIVVPPPQDYYRKSATPNGNGTTTKPAAVKPAPSPAPTPQPAKIAVVQTSAPPPVPDGWDEPDDTPQSVTTPPRAAPSLANMNKEEKELEMARRREERKARIAAMKEQKKGKS